MVDSDPWGKYRFNERATSVPENGARRWRSVRNHVEWEHDGGRRPISMRPDGGRNGWYVDTDRDRGG